ncbi:MAG: hypothetical protein R3F59_30215 [Myxococcota bacterium]
MSTLLARLHAAFDDAPVLLAPLRATAPPSEAHLRVLAEHLAALANHPHGGVLVLGLDPGARPVVRGVTHPPTWTAALRRAAKRLDPPVPIEVEVGEEDGRAVVAAHVPFVPVVRGRVRLRDGAAMRLVDGRPTPEFRALPSRASGPVPALLASVPGSAPAWLDPEATRGLHARPPAAWSPATRAAMAEEGLLAADGVAVTRLGLLLAGLPERRPDEDAVVLELPTGVLTLPRGWLLLREDLRAEAREAGVRRTDLVADLVMDVLVRTAGPAARGPVVVDLSPEALTIEAPRPLRDDPEIAGRMARWAGWRRDAWLAPAKGWHLPVRWEADGPGLRVVAALVRPEPARPAPRSPSPAPSVPPPAPTPGASAPTPTDGPTTHQPRSAREAAVLDLLADGRAWSRRELDARLRWSRSTLRNVLEGLVEAGRVVTEAPSPRSPFQAYRAA